MNKSSPRLAILRAQHAAKAEAEKLQRDTMRLMALAPIRCKAPAPDAATLPLPPSYWDDMEHWLKTLAPAKPAAPKPCNAPTASCMQGWRLGESVPRNERVGLWHYKCEGDGAAQTSTAQNGHGLQFGVLLYRQAAPGAKIGDPYDESKYATADMTARLASTSSADGAALVGAKLTHSVCIKAHGGWKVGHVRVTDAAFPERFVPCDKDGWIPHEHTHNSVCPVPAWLSAEVRTRDGRTRVCGEAERSSANLWRFEGTLTAFYGDFVAWRPIKDGSK